ncbi:MAG: response regulator [Anaerolineae bacterium]|nr:response regulator [Anaerolineae bacterium]
MTLLLNKRIFIVEDNMQNRVIFQIALVRYGAIVDFERMGRDTIYRLRGKDNLDLIILDLMLAEGLSGFDLVEQIRALPNCATVPILAVSAMDAAVAMPKARAMGFAGFIAKPIDNYDFPKQVLAVINGEQVWHAGDMGS